MLLYDIDQIERSVQMGRLCEVHQSISHAQDRSWEVGANININPEIYMLVYSRMDWAVAK